MTCRFTLFYILRRPLPVLCLLLGMLAFSVATGQEERCAELLAIAESNPRLDLVRTEHEGSGTVFVQGWYRVFENRESREGREIRLLVVVLPAVVEDPAPDPVFILHGGPGAAATQLFRRQVRGWMRERRDVVLIDQRGTGRSNPLHIPGLKDDDDLQTYFEPMFQPELYKAALPALQKKADLTQYTTANAVDDFDEVRAALGYNKVNLRGGSYGTRSALVYMRRHPDSVRTATLQGIQPIAYRNPLPHAASAQESIDLIFEECRSTPQYREAFPDIEAKFHETLARLEAQPAEVAVNHPVNGEEVTVVIDRTAFAESVRVLLYTVPSNRRLPMLLMAAHRGDYRQIVQAGLLNSRGVRRNLAFGAMMCVVASEDISRIDPAEIEAECADTFLGPVRIETEMAVARIWPHVPVPPEFAEPVDVDIPVLLFSGTHDPATTPYWGAEAARHLPASLHVVMPSGHGVSGPAVEKLERVFLESGTVEGLDLSEIEKLKLPPLILPEG